MGRERKTKAVGVTDSFGKLHCGVSPFGGRHEIARVEADPRQVGQNPRPQCNVIAYFDEGLLQQIRDTRQVLPTKFGQQVQQLCSRSSGFQISNETYQDLSCPRSVTGIEEILGLRSRPLVSERKVRFGCGS